MFIFLSKTPATKMSVAIQLQSPLTTAFKKFEVASDSEDDHSLKITTEVEATKVEATKVEATKVEAKEKNSPNGSIPIFLKDLEGKTRTLYIPSEDTTIDEFKLMVEEITGNPTSQQRIIFAGRQLEDGRSFKDYNIKPESTLHMVLRLRGGMFHSSSGREGTGAMIFSGIGMIEDPDRRRTLRDSFSWETEDKISTRALLRALASIDFSGEELLCEALNMKHPKVLLCRALPKDTSLNALHPDTIKALLNEAIDKKRL